MYVKLRGLRFARKFTQSLSEFLLKLVVELVLLAEEDDAALRDYAMLASNL